MKKLIKISEKGQLRRAARKLLVDEPEKLIDYPPEGWDKTEWKNLCNQPYSQRLLTASIFIDAELKRIT